ncbi:MAG: TRAP transporter large permease [Gammaproteobacteria bacterium]|nr:TRAP transporter large permease [Gammaproteobacteria bacterium]
MLIIVFLLLLAVGLPIAFVLAETAVAYIWISDNSLLFLSYPQQLFSGLERYGLLAIPLFILTGELMNEGGITRRLIAVAGIFVGGLRGGLAYINLLANMMMASIVGSGTAQIAMMSRAMVPEMTRHGYPPEFAAATTAAGGLLSPIIPPSMLFIIFGVLAQIGIGDLFLAGIVPGVMMALGFLIAIALLGLRYQYPKGQWYSFREVRRHLLWGLPAGLVPLVIVGGILAGIATPTESAALAALAAFLVGKYVYRDLDTSHLPAVFIGTARTSAMVLFLIGAANVFGWVIVFERIPQAMAAWLTELTTNPFVFLLLVNVFMLVVGMVIDGIAALILIVPILLPVAQSVYGIGPYHFGVIVCINVVLGLLTPPVGAGLFVASAAANVSPGKIFTALLPFLLTTIAVLVILSANPSLVTWLLQ